ncbi:MAG: hypothetical protein ISS35_04155 [Kiritimatiellae bacterium]|nr:hypothetical protein [Kiritimatiellia bacterium]
MAGHLSVGVDPLDAGIGYGEGLGSASISGGPYHFYVIALDGASLGKQDNQIKGADIKRVPATPPPCIASNSGPVCEGDDVTLFAELVPDATYSWSGPGGFSSIDANPVISTAALADAGTYTVVVTAADVSSTCTTDVAVHALPTCGIEGPAGPLCPESLGHIYVGPLDMASYLWQVSGNATILGDATNSMVVVDVGSNCSQTFTVMLAIANENGCTNACSVQVSVADDTPVISCPSNISVDCIGNVPAAATNESEFLAAGGSISNACGGAISVLSADGALTNGPCGGTILRSYVIFDRCGNAATCDQTITVHDQVAPDVACTNDIAIECEEDLPPAVTTIEDFWALIGTATDNCNGSLTVGSSDGSLAGGACGGTIARTYTISDYCGNSSSCTQVITVADNTPPEAACTNDISIECIEDLPPAVTTIDDFRDLIGTATDNCIGDLTLTSTNGPLEGGACGGTITRTYTIRDLCGNSTNCDQVITIADNTPPSITCPGPTNVETLAEVPDAATSLEEFEALGGSASDNCLGDLSLSVSNSALVGGICGGIITRTYTVTDPCGNSNSCAQIIAVSDDSPPTVTCPDGIEIYSDEPVPSGATNLAEFLLLGGTALDNGTSEQLLVSYVDGAYDGDDCAGTVTRTYTITDPCQNRVTCDQIITIVDAPPMIECPPDLVFTCEDCPTNLSPDALGWAIAIDGDGSPLEVEYSDELVGDCPQVLVRTWTTTDACSNTASCVQTMACLPAALVTSSSLCTFDVDDLLAGRQFLLRYTHDGLNKVCQKLTSSNPGQTFFNVIYHGESNEVVSFYLTLPYPYVTQGATPLHAYDWVGVDVGQDASICLLPGNTIWEDKTRVTLESYGGGSEVIVAAEDLVVPESGMIYLNIHLDYGLKGQGGLGRDMDNNAIECWDANTNGVLDVVIPDLAEYTFSMIMTNEPPESAEDTVQSINDLKHAVGVSGLVLGDSGTVPLPGLTVNLLNRKGRVKTSAVTDDLGAYVLNYRNIGNGATYYVQLVESGGETREVLLELDDDGYAQINFNVD